MRKKLNLAWLSMIIIAGAILFFWYSSEAIAAGENLIMNPSLETSIASGTMPENWFTNSWGINTAEFVYEQNGHNSSASAYVKLSGRKSGDAKWYFEPVAVEPDTEYVFSDYFKSNVVSKFVVLSLDSQGNPSYYDIGGAASSSVWKRKTISFKTLNNSAKISVFHLIQRNGWLQIDDVNLVKVNPAPITDMIPNNSMEIPSLMNANLPQNWTKARWGDNKPTYAYLKNGHDGARSIKVTMTNYKSGDAKWIFTPQPLQGGKDYKFSAWYKTNTIPHVVAWFTMNDGTENYFGLPDPEPKGTGWQFYSDVFNVPENVKSVSVFFFLTNNGWVQTDDYHIVPYQYTGFDEGLVSLMFDDGFERNASSVLPILKQYGFKATQCAATKFIEGMPEQIEFINKFTGDGHELCSHSITHPFLSGLDAAALDIELKSSKDYLEKTFNVPVTNFASPYGDYNTNVIEQMKKYYLSHRTVNEGFNSKDNFDPYRLRVQNVGLTTTQAQVQEWVNKAQAEKTWLILVYHVVDTTDLGQFDTTIENFKSQIQRISESGIKVLRWDEALKSIKAQI